MATVCNEITADVERDCDALPGGGVKPVMRLINIDDIEEVTYDVTNPVIVTNITLKTGKRAFKYEVYKNGHKPRFTRVNDDFGYAWNHEVDSSIQTWDNASKAQVIGLNGASVVAILENNQKNSDAGIEIYGLESGLGVADGAIRNLAENKGVFVFTLQSDPESLEPEIPRSLWAANYAATQAILASLDVVAPAP